MSGTTIAGKKILFSEILIIPNNQEVIMDLGDLFEDIKEFKLVFQPKDTPESRSEVRWGTIENKRMTIDLVGWNNFFPISTSDLSLFLSDAELKKKWYFLAFASQSGNMRQIQIEILEEYYG